MEDIILTPENYLLNEKLQMLLKKELINGIPNPIWIRNEALIERFIKKNKDMLVKYKQPAVIKKGKEVVDKKIIADEVHMAFEDRRWWRGGIRVAHIHFRDDIYVLDDRQWADFSNQLVDTLKAKLESANTINFNQALELSEAIYTLV